MRGDRLLVRQGQPAARQVLDERLARGEISREEYETILQILNDRRK
ncbi:MAG: SHOCT domain-containing protein [Chloroflexi bacterium]|nr:SHOCT domain-containing protein [Chloroflexota bacterium]